MTPNQKDKILIKPLVSSTNNRLTTPVGNFQSKTKNLNIY